MNDQERLGPWVVYRLLPTLRRLALARFQDRGEAQAYLKLLRQVLKDARFTLVFEETQAEEAD